MVDDGETSASDTADPSITVIVPAYNAATILTQVLLPLIEFRDNGDVLEVIVVDDRSTDSTVALAEELGAKVLTTPTNGGPGVARNVGAEQAEGNILWFVDSDVVVHPESVTPISEAFKDRNLGAIFGSYDDTPQSTAWFSQYKNLLHHFHHQRGNVDAKTFWAGCGAVRKSVFHDVGGFDTQLYRVPSIEDIELGYRISNAGHRIELNPKILCKHLKHWTIPNAIKTDVFKRALPWARLMIAREGLGNDLNTSIAERLRAVLALIFVLSVLGIPLRPDIWPVAASATILVFLANFSLFRLFYFRGGFFMAVAGMLYHQFYYIYSASVFAWCLFEFHILGRQDNLGVFK